MGHSTKAYKSLFFDEENTNEGCLLELEEPEDSTIPCVKFTREEKIDMHKDGKLCVIIKISQKSVGFNLLNKNLYDL